MSKNQKTVVKLIRNKLKAMIEQGEKHLPKSRRTKFGIASRSTQLLFAAEKVFEEMGEVIEALKKGDPSKAHAEMADFSQALVHLHSFPEFDIRRIENLRMDKLSKKGGFDKNIIASFHPKTFAELYAEKPRRSKKLKKTTKQAKKQKQR